MAEYGKSNSVPRLFTAFASFKNSPAETVDPAVMMSPTSILDTKPYSGLKNPFSSSDPNPTRNPAADSTPKRSQYWEKLDSPKIGLGLVDVLLCDDQNKNPIAKLPAESRMVLFGSQLKIQIPSSLLHLPPSSSPASSPRSPADFGIKTRSSQLGSSSFSSAGLSPPLKSANFGSDNSGLDVSISNSPPPPRVLTAGEMELSEDYTCVISHGPNPKTTHIFDDCIVDSCCGVFTFNSSAKEAPDDDLYPSESFLSYCDNCRKTLGQGKDIYMYRGEKAFCSKECRYREMVMEGDEMDHEEIYGNCS